MSDNPKLLKVLDFKPNLLDQNDKRNLKHARDEMEYEVTKNYNLLGIPCFAGVPVLDPKRGIVGLELFALSEPLKKFFDNGTKEALLEAMQESMVDILAKVKQLNDGKSFDPLASGTSLTNLAKPLKPVFLLNSTEMASYFSALKSSIARKDGVKITRKWAKIVKGKLEKPTEIPSFDAFVESVLSSSQYFGSQTKFEPGNLLWRMQLVCAYLLEINGYDYNTYAHNVPADYVAKIWKIEDFIKMGKNPTESAENNVLKRKRKTKVDNIEYEQHWLGCNDNPFNDDTDESEQETEVEKEPNDGLTNREDDVALDDSLLGSHKSGTPTRDDSESGKSSCSKESLSQQISFENRLKEMSQRAERSKAHQNNKQSVLAEMREEENDILHFSTGAEREGGYVMQVYGVTYVEDSKSYRATVSDGTKATDKVLFNSSLNEKVEQYLEDRTSVVKIVKHRIFDKSVIVVDRFTAYWDAEMEILGDPKMLRKDYLKTLLTDAEPVAEKTTPGNLHRNLTSTPKLSKKNRTVGN
jgi:hypothetical protein